MSLTWGHILSHRDINWNYVLMSSWREPLPEAFSLNSEVDFTTGTKDGLSLIGKNEHLFTTLTRMRRNQNQGVGSISRYEFFSFNFFHFFFSILLYVKVTENSLKISIWPLLILLSLKTDLIFSDLRWTCIYRAINFLYQFPSTYKS